MALTADAISWFHTPMGYNGPKGASRTREAVQTWLEGRGKDVSIFKRASGGTYAGLATFALGIIANIFGFKKDNAIFKWGGILLAGIGAGSAFVGEAFSALYKKGLFSPVKAQPGEIEAAESQIENKTSVYVTSGDGKLTGYHLDAPTNTKKTILYLHGRGQHNGHCLPAADAVRTHSGANVLVMDYRGFGESTGTLDQRGVVKDARVMYQFLLDRGIDPKDITIYGHSLGGAIGIQLVNELQNEREPIIVPHLIIQSSFTKPSQVADEYTNKIIPDWIVNKIVDDQIFNSIEDIQKIDPKTKVSIAHGDKDEYVGKEQSEALFNAIKATHDTKLSIMQGCKHSDFFNFIGQTTIFKDATPVSP